LKTASATKYPNRTLLLWLRLYFSLVARCDNKKVQLPTSGILRTAGGPNEMRSRTPAGGQNLDQLDRLLTLSCYAVGTTALLSSVFFELGVERNICGA